MNNEKFDEYVISRYKVQMDYYKTTSSKNQKRYKRLQWLLITLSSITPVLVALKEIKIPVIGSETALSSNWLVLLSASLLAILTAGLKIFNYHELWINARITYEKLKPEIHYFDFEIGEYGVECADKQAIFVSRVEAILKDEHGQWPINRPAGK